MGSAVSGYQILPPDSASNGGGYQVLPPDATAAPASLAGSPGDIAARALAQQGLPPAATPNAPTLVPHPSGVGPHAVESYLTGGTGADTESGGLVTPAEASEWNRNRAGFVQRQDQAGPLKMIGEGAASVLEGSPNDAGPAGSGLPLAQGIPDILRGAKNIATAGNRQDVYKGGAQLIGGTLNELAPAFASGLIEKPVQVGAGLITGMLTAKGAQLATAAAGGSKEAQDFAEAAGFFIPSIVGLNVRASTVPGERGAIVSGLGDKVAVGATEAPGGGVAIGGRFGSKTAGTVVGAPSAPSGPGIPEQSPIQGEPGSVGPPITPPSPTEVSQKATMDENVVAMSKATQVEQQSAEIAARVASGQPPPQPPPVTPQTVEKAAQQVESLPPEHQPQALIDSHKQLTGALAKQGSAIVDGKVIPVGSPKEAAKVAAEIINQQAEKAQNQPAPAPVPPVTPQHVEAAAAQIEALPPEQQPAALVQSHQQLAAALTQQGSAVVDGQVVPVTSPKEAAKVAAEIINAQVEKLDEAAKLPSNLTEASKPEESTQLQPEIAQNEPISPARPAYQIQPPLKSGDAVTFAKNGQSFKGNVERVFPSGRVQLRDDAGKLHTGDAGKLRVMAAGETIPAKPETKAAKAETKEPTKYKFGSTQANIHGNSEAADAIKLAQARISESDLMPQDNGKSIEDEPHVTVRYGIQSENTVGIKKYLESLSPFEATLGKTDKFPPSEHSDGAAVIVAPIESPDLHRINQEIEQHGDFTEPSFKEYKPHATIAYVKPEKADRYVGMDVTHGKKFTVDKVAIMDRNGGKEVVKLGGNPIKQRIAAQKAAKPAQAFPKSVSAPGSYGGDTVVKTPSGDLPAKYKVVEAANLLPSHDAETFAKNPGYPEGVQERAYHSSKEAQNRVIQQAQNYDPAYTVNTNPDAVNGPPVVTKSGMVLGGNSRAMATQRLYRRGGGDAYRNAISQQASQFGIDPETVKDYKAPVLVREVPNPATIEEARKLGSDLNKSMTGSLGVAEKAVSAGKSITPETLQRIAGMIDELGGDASIRDVLRDKGRDIIPMLEKDGLITARERPAFVTATGGLSDEGKTFVERALRRLIVDDPDLMERTPKSILNKLDGSLADIVGVAQRTDEYNILPLLRAALAEHADIAARGSDVETHLAQAGMFAGERNPAVEALVRKLGEKSKAVKDALRQFTQDANFDQQGQGMLAVAEEPSPVNAFNAAFGTNLSEDQFQQSLIDASSNPEHSGERDVSRTQEETENGANDLQQHPAETASRGGPASPEETPVKPRIVPGARSSATGNETGRTSIQDLTDSIRRQVPDSKSMGDRLKAGADIGASAVGGVKDALSEAWGKLKGATAAIVEAYKNPRSSILLPRTGYDVSDYERGVGHWSRADNVSASNLYEFRKANEKAVPDKTDRKAISVYVQAGGDQSTLDKWAKDITSDPSTSKYADVFERATKLKNEYQTIARNTQNHNDSTLQEMQQAGILREGIENYMMQVWKDNPKMLAKVRAETNWASLQTKPSFTKERTIPTYYDGIKLGYTPADMDYAFLTSAHERALREAMAARAFIAELKGGKASDGRPLVATSWASAKEIDPEEAEKSAAYMIKPNLNPGDDVADYRTVDHPALRGWRWAGEADGKPIFVQGDMLVHPEIARHLKNDLGKSAIRSYHVELAGHDIAVGEAVLNTFNALKSTILVGSRFHETTLEFHSLEHRTIPWGLDGLDFNDPQQMRLLDGGLMVANYDGMDAFSEGLSGKGLQKLPGIGHLIQAYNDHLFKEKLPSMKMATGLNALKRNDARYEKIYSPEKIAQITAKQMNAAYGGLNYRMMGRNQTVQDALRIIAMAPDFLEARAKFVAQSYRPQGREQLFAKLLGTLMLFTAAEITARLSHGEHKLSDPYRVHKNGKAYGMRSVQGDEFDAITQPGKFLMNRASPAVGAAIKFGEGKNYFGKKQSAWQTAQDLARHNVPIPVQPWTVKNKDSNVEKAWETGLRIAGLQVTKEQKPKK